MLQGGPTTQVGRSPYRCRQTVHPTPGACRPRRREPGQSKRTRNRQLRSTAERQGTQRPPGCKPARTRRSGRDTQRNQKTGAMGAEIVTGSQRARQGDTPRPRHPARVASGHEKQGQRSPSRHGRSGGRSHVRGPVHHNTVRHTAQERVAGGHGMPVGRGNPQGRERGKTSPEVR